MATSVSSTAVEVPAFQPITFAAEVLQQFDPLGRPDQKSATKLASDSSGSHVVKYVFGDVCFAQALGQSNTLQMEDVPLSPVEVHPAQVVCFEPTEVPLPLESVTPSLQSVDVVTGSREVVFIPRPKVFTSNMDVFTDLRTFSKVTGFIPTSQVTRVTTKVPKIITQVRALRSVFRGLKRSVLPSKSSHKHYDTLTDKPALQLFPYETMQEWKKMKKALLTRMYRHQDALSDLREARKACWKSEAKVKKYELIVFTQKSALRHNPGQKEARTRALKEMEGVLNQKQMLHIKNVDAFKKKFLHEVFARDSVVQLAGDVQSEIMVEMETAITRLMRTNRQDVSAEQVADFARQIYSMTSRSYCFEKVSPDPCHKEWVTIPSFNTSKMNRKVMLKMSA